jgi:PAS domain S-box-containing protein
MRMGRLDHARETLRTGTQTIRGRRQSFHPLALLAAASLPLLAYVGDRTWATEAKAPGLLYAVALGLALVVAGPLGGLAALLVSFAVFTLYLVQHGSASAADTAALVVLLAASAGLLGYTIVRQYVAEETARIELEQLRRLVALPGASPWRVDFSTTGSTVRGAWRLVLARCRAANPIALTAAAAMPLLAYIGVSAWDNFARAPGIPYLLAITLGAAIAGLAGGLAALLVSFVSFTVYLAQQPGFGAGETAVLVLLLAGSVGFLGYVILRRDIAERTAETELEHLRAALAASVGSIWELDLTTGAFTVVASSLAEIPGFPQVVWHGSGPAGHDGAATRLEELTASSSASYDVSVRDAAGKPHLLRTRATLGREPGGRQFVRAATIDVTEQNARERWYRALFESQAVGVTVGDHDRRLVAYNPTFARMLGYDEHELVGRFVAELDHPDDLELSVGQLARLERGEIPAFTVEKRYLRSDGTTMWARLTVSPIAGETDPPLYFGIVQDITEQRELEEQLRQSQKLEAIGELAGGVAHDFNNLLTVIIGHAELALAQPDADPQPDLREILDTSKRAAGLVRQLLAFSRKQVLQPQVIDLNAVITQMGSMLDRLIEEHIEVVTDLAEEAVRVVADPTHVEQVILNLAINARDAMGPGGRLTIRTRLDRVDGADRGVLIVEDTGHGMDDATLARVFEPFFTTKETGRGTGLGLSTVYGIVKQSGGEIAVESEPGRGTTFTISLPAAGRADGSPAGVGPARESSLRS